jgi:dTDP-glucose 4,6-dehydratase
VRQVDDRPGHDRRYAMDGAKLAALGWRPTIRAADGIPATVDWYVANAAWWRAIKAGDWDAYYERQYGARLRGGEAAPPVVKAAAASDAASPAAAPTGPGSD